MNVNQIIKFRYYSFIDSYTTQTVSYKKMVT